MSNASRKTRRKRPGNPGRVPSPHGPLTVCIGGPSYRMEVDARHASSFYALVFEGLETSIFVNGWQYKHAVPVEYAREAIFESVLNFNAPEDEVHGQWDFLLWLDSDVFWSPSQTRWVLEMIRDMHVHGRPFGTAPCLIRGETDQTNIWVPDGDHGLQQTQKQIDRIVRKPFEIFASGFGMACFNLNLYRKKWPSSPWFMTHVSEDGKRLSEDTWHTVQLSKKFGRPGYCYPIELVHADRGAARVGIAGEKSQPPQSSAQPRQP